MEPKPKSKTVVGQRREKVTTTSLKNVCLTISSFLDVMNSPTFREDYFRQVFTQSKTQSVLLAENDELEVSFTFRRKKKGGSL